MKDTVVLAYYLNDKTINKFFENVKFNKDYKYLIFYKDLSNNDLQRLRDNYDCTLVKKKFFMIPQFEIFKYLEVYDYIFFTNVNVDINNIDLSLYKNKPLSTINCMNSFFVEGYFKKMISGYNMFKSAHDFSILIINKELRNYNEIYRWLKKTIKKYYFLMDYPTFATLELMIQKFNLDVGNVILRDNIVPEKHLCQKQKILNKKVNGELVSVIMPVYNRTDTIMDAIKSITNQTYRDLELIIIVEKSDVQDEINKVISKIKDNRIIIINNTKKLGLADSLNVGIRKAKGKYIARMDDDDISDYSRIAKQVNYLKNNKDIAIVGSYMKFFGNSDLVCKLPTDSDSLKVNCLYKTPLFHPTVMFNLNVLSKKDLVYSIGTRAEDYDLWSKLIEKYKIANIPEVLYYYNLSGSNSSVVNEEKLNDSHLDIMRYQLDKYLNMNLTFDELQLLSGRIDVLGHSKNIKKVYYLKKKIWKNIINSNKKTCFYNSEILNNELKEAETYYREVSKIKR